MNVYIVSAQRTAVASFQGGLKDISAPRLGSLVIQSALKKANLKPDNIDECIMGQVLTAGAGQAPARQAALYAGLLNSTPCLTINKVCGSGLKAAMLASDSIRLGHSKIVAAGGQENMTLAPHLLEKSREGYRMGPVTLTDSMLKDGLIDPYNHTHMGNAAELCAKDYHFSRESQDEFAKHSYEKAKKAQERGDFDDEISPVETMVGKETISFKIDEEPAKARFDKMLTLKPAFEKDGTITAANASKLNDGAACLIFANEESVKAQGLKPLAKVLGYATFAQEPKWFTTAPVGAIKKVLNQLSLSVNDIDLFEINEAFSVVAQVAVQELKINLDRLNVNGGAVALGHPIGASGARLLTTLVHALQKRNLKRGLASLCIGGGEGVALVVERV